MKIENVFKLKTYFNIEKLDGRDVFRAGPGSFFFPTCHITDRHFAFRKFYWKHTRALHARSHL